MKSARSTDTDFERAVRQTLAAVAARSLTSDEGVSRILAAYASSALPYPDYDGEAKKQERELLWAKFQEFGADRWAAGKAAAAVHKHDPQKRESAERWLRRERAKRTGHVSGCRADLQP